MNTVSEYMPVMGGVFLVISIVLLIIFLAVVIPRMMIKKEQPSIDVLKRRAIECGKDINSLLIHKRALEREVARLEREERLKQKKGRQ